MQILNNTGAVEVKALAGSSARAELQAASISAKPSPALTNHTARKKMCITSNLQAAAPDVVEEARLPRETQKSVNEGGFGRLTSR